MEILLPTVVKEELIRLAQPMQVALFNIHERFLPASPSR
jgi:hypothetical protein